MKKIRRGRSTGSFRSPVRYVSHAIDVKIQPTVYMVDPMMDMSRGNPDAWPEAVYERDGNWYHADETWSEEHGPFRSEKEARQRLAEYALWLDTGILPYRMSPVYSKLFWINRLWHWLFRL